MSYLVNKTDGTLLATVFDGQTNSPTSPTGSSSITLIGKQVSNYGELQNENFVHIMENFSASTDPVFPIEGQLWWNKTTKVMSVFDGSAWYPVTGFTKSDSAPVSPRSGDQWWDSLNKQYKLYDGTTWIVIGPAYSVLDGKSGALVENVYDVSTLVKHSIVKMYSNGNVIAIMSNVAPFTPNVAIEGFTTINPGITFSTSIDAVKVYGTATNSDLLGNLTPTQFLRSDIDSTTTANLSIQQHAKIGPYSELELSTYSGAVYVTSNLSNKNMHIRANVAGTLTDALLVDGTTGLVTVADNPTADYGISTKVYTDTGISTARSDLTYMLSSNVQSLTNLINDNFATLQNEIDTTNSAVSLKAPIYNPSFTGAPTSITPSDGDSSTRIATTKFVANSISSFDTTKIYNGNTFVKANSSDVSVTVSGNVIVTVDSTGLKATTQSSNDNSTKVATTEYVDRAVKNYVLNSVAYAPTVYVSAAPPSNATGNDGDIWFQYQ